jgi:hypothetical protein
VLTKLSAFSALPALFVASFVSLGAGGCAASSDEPLDDEELGIDSDAVRRGGAAVEGEKIEPTEIARLLREADVPSSMINKMVCTAFYESRWRDRSWNARNNNGTTDRGLFQVNSIHLKNPNGICDDFTAEDLWSPTKNAQCAAKILDVQGLSAWYGYRSHRTTKVEGGYRRLGCDVYKVGDAIETRL